LIAAGLSVCGDEPIHVPHVGCREDLLAAILDRLEQLTGEVPFDGECGFWRARCPIDPSHDVFVVVLDNKAIDLLDTEHSLADLCSTLGLRPHGIDPARVWGYIGVGVEQVAVIRPDESS
jgi:hypothetical protein